jgi:hypothetical protein
MGAPTPQIEEIRARSWAGSGHELVALLGHQDPAVRSAAAVRLAEISLEECGLPSLAYVFGELAGRDAVNPGIADAFWTTLV